MIALTVSWIPLVADYTRFSRSRRSAFWGVGIGYLLPTLFQFGFGAILGLSHPRVDGPTAVLTQVAAGGRLDFRPPRLMVAATDEAFASCTSAAVSLQNRVPRASQRLLIVLVALTARCQQFLLLPGAFFVPLFGVLLADWSMAVSLLAGRRLPGAGGSARG